MGFEGLLGNHQLKVNLSGSLKKGHISHFYLISGPAGSGKHTLARLLAAAIFCRSSDKPCCACPECRRSLENSHPDFITVDDPEKKTVSVDLIRQARADIYIQPNQADHKIYLFPRAQDMGISAQNALLKVLEEPPRYGVFLLLSDNPEKLLPTVRSRCTELQLRPLEEQELRKALGQEFPQAQDSAITAAIGRSGGFLGQAKELLSGGSDTPPQVSDILLAMIRRDNLLLATTLAGMEKLKRDQLIPLLEQVYALLEQALASRSGIPAMNPLSREVGLQRSPGQIMNALTHLRKGVEYAQSNVSPAAICSYLSWELR